jgi:hypothetical protein
MHLYGQDPTAFGFTKIKTNAQTVFQANTMGFEQPKQRDDAFKKWETWVAKQRSQEAPPADQS